MRMFFPIALAAICCAPMLTACDSREGETVESAYVLPPYPDPSYASSATARAVSTIWSAAC